ncbi:PPE domain-containing protein [Lentzea albida]|uniref:PPE family protein n=1 Tax=Lentzea albida TaxID=65499 RepID=A0A1H9AHD8_9PSEU|nr:PPE domain-containing protein [Lentzea albida]SEP76154.1 PPE family protein [Lentzea albida]
MSHGSHDNKGNDHNRGGNGDRDDKSHGRDDGYRSELHEPVDWMTYTHEQLYNMVHTGVNLAGAQAAATNWQKIGEDIAGVRTSLLKAVEDSSVGWDSESARLARDGLTEVTNWVDDTANYATKVSAAITTETSNVEAARAAMPPPPAAPQPPVPTDAALVNRAVLQDRLTQVDGFGALQNERLIAQQPQTDFAGFETIGTSPVDTLAANDASHRLAADVMATFQKNSAAVDQTVPQQFTPPVNPINPTPTGGDLTNRSHTGGTPDGGAGGAGGAPVATSGAQNQNRGTTNASSRFGGGGGGGGRGGAGGFGGFGGGMARPFGSGNQSGSGGGGAGGGVSGGNVAGVNDGARGGGAGGAAAAASAAPGNTTKAFQNPLAMGGAPMAGAPAAGGGQNDSKEHKTASYLEEDDNVFGLDRKAAPPVIGQ